MKKLVTPSRILKSDNLFLPLSTANPKISRPRANQTIPRINICFIGCSFEEGAVNCPPNRKNSL